MSEAWRRRQDDLVVEIRVQPRARNNEVVGIRNGRLLVRTTAAPADGKANQAVIRLVAKYFGVPPSRIALQRGASGRDKRLLVGGPVEPPDEV